MRKLAIYLGWTFVSGMAMLQFRLLLSAFRVEYLPTPLWVTQSRYVVVLLTLVMYAFWLTLGTQSYRRQNKDFDLRALIALVTLAVMAPMISDDMVRNEAPFLVAIFGGHAVSENYVVESVDHGSMRGCHTPLVLRDMPILAKQLCSHAAPLYGKLKAGDDLTITGRGTGLGLIVRSIQITSHG